MRNVLIVGLVMALASCAPSASTTDDTTTSLSSPPSSNSSDTVNKFNTERDNLIAEAKKKDPRGLVIINPVNNGISISRLINKDRLIYSFQFTENRMYFTLKNTDVYPVAVNWTRSTFTTVEGVTSGVYHSTTPLEQLRAAQFPTIIEPGNTLADFVAPSYLVKSKTAPWNIKPLLKNNQDERPFILKLYLEVDKKPVIHEFKFQKLRSYT